VVTEAKHSNVDNLKSVRREDSRQFKKEKKKEYFRAKIDELEYKNKVKNVRDFYRGINYFKKDYHPRTNTVKYEKGDLVADCHSILAMWREHFLSAVECTWG
jgi:hypothetical protein